MVSLAVSNLSHNCSADILRHIFGNLWEGFLAIFQYLSHNFMFATLVELLTGIQVESNQIPPGIKQIPFISIHCIRDYIINCITGITGITGITIVVIYLN
jgi:hypothetical protein